MVYVPTNWTDGVTPVDAANLSHLEAGVVAVDAAIPNKEDKAAKGAASGYAPLDAGSKVPAANLPALTDMNYQGVYSAATAYKDGDIVSYNGVLYVCVTPTTGSPPENWGVPPGDTGWTQMTLLNGATHYNAPYGPAQFRKLSSGLVVCQGLINIATAGATVFTFPVGYRPTPTRQFIFAGAGSLALAEAWRVDASGTLTPPASATAGNFLSVANVAFYAEG